MKEFYKTTCRPGSGLTNQLQLLWRYAMVLAAVFLFTPGVIAQDAPNLPDPGDCVSNDLIVVGARLTNGQTCYTCEEGDEITSNLTLTLFNKTGSTRTSFAFWATLERTNSEGVVTTSQITQCQGPVPPGAEYPLNFGTITYKCGDALRLTNIYLAWTEASPNATCPLDPSKIAPKCGTAVAIEIIPPLSARVASSVKPCVGESNGSIKVFTQGGTGAYTYTLNPGATANSTGVFENLSAGNYTISVTDEKQCSTEVTFTLGDQACCVPPTVSAQPDDESVCEGEGASFMVAYTGGEPTPVIQWQMSTDDGANWVNVTNTGVYSGATTAALSISATTEAMNGNWYRASLKSGTCDAVYTNPAELEVNEIPAAPTSGGNKAICATDPVQTLTATATAPAGSTVVWYSEATGGSVVASPTLSAVGSITFYAEALSEAGCRSTTRTAVSLTINAVPDVPALSVRQPDCTDAMGRLTITSSTTGLLFSVNGAAYVAYPENGWSLAAGDYTVTAQNENECISAEVTITINAQPASPATPVVTVSQPTCAQAGCITVTSPEGEGYTYSLDGETWQAVTVFANLNAGDYTVRVKNAAGCITAGDEVTINPVPDAPATPVVMVTQPNCNSPMGIIVVTSPTAGLMFSFNGGEYAAYPTGGYTLAAGAIYTLVARNAALCVSGAVSGTINAQPVTPDAPMLIASHPTCEVATGKITVTSSTTGLVFRVDNVNSGDDDNGYVAYPTDGWAELAPGTYNVTARNEAGCISSVATIVINNQPATPNANAGADKVLTCTATTVMLSGSSTTAGVTYAWVASNGGNIVSGANTATPIVNAAGTYTLTVTNTAGSCTAMDVAVVTRDASVPSVSISTSSGLPQITCDNPTVQLGAYSNTDGVTYKWTGPDGFASTEQGISVTVAGEYTVTVTNTANGCSASTGITVTGPIYAKVNAGPDKVLTCETTSVMLEGYVEFPEFDSWSWLAEDGGVIPDERSLNLEVTVPGTYILRVYARGGCMSEDRVVVRMNKTSPDVRITSPGTVLITCNNPTTSFSGFSENEGAMYSWTGPEGFTSNNSSLEVSVPGLYVLTVTNPVNGCTATAEITVPDGRIYTNVNAGPDKVLSCQASTVTLEGSSTNYTEGNNTFYWTASDGGNIVSGANTWNPVVNAAGTYTLTINTIRSGCTSTDVVVVTRDGSTPNVSAKGGTLSCANGSLQLMGYSTTAGVSYFWTGPNGYTSSMQHPVVTMAGNYTLTVTNRSNGCTASTTVTVNPQPKGSDPIVTCHTMNFGYDHHRKGLITTINTPEGPVGVTGRKRNPDGTYAAQNYAALFDTQAPTGDDTDLYTSDWGLALIINQDQTNVPNDNQWGGEMILDFSAIGPVTMESLKALDIDGYEGMSWVYLYDGQGNELYKVRLQNLGDNSKQMVNLGNTKGVMMMKIVLDGRNESGQLAGSGAIDDIRFCVEEPGAPCVDEEQETMDAVSISSVSAYPTPFSERATIEFRVHNTENYVVNLYDTKGMLIKQLKTGTAVAGEMNTVEVDGRNMADGMYLARIASESGAKTVKLILKR